MFDTVSAAGPAHNPETVLMARRQGAEILKARAGWRQLEALPVGLFSSIMALAVLSVAWRLAHAIYNAPIWIADAFMALAVVAFIVLTVGYAVKLVVAPNAVRAEFRHPITGPLFGTVPTSMLLLPIVLEPLSSRLATALWALGTVGAVMFAWLMVSRWASGRQSVVHPTPTWIIPVVGLLAIPLAQPSLDLPPMHGVMAFGFGVGMFFTVPLFALIFGRLVFEPPLPNGLQPSVLVLVAPFATGFVTYVAMMRQVDLFPKVLYVIMGFLSAVLLPRLRYLGCCCPFRVSWWAVGFPLAMASLPALHFATTEPRLTTNVVALGLLAIATGTVGGLLCRTVIGLARRELRTLSDG